MASPSPNLAQNRILTIAACVALLVLSILAVGFVIWGARRIFSKPGQQRALLDVEVDAGATHAGTPHTKISTPPMSHEDTDPFQTPIHNQDTGAHPPQWAVQYQQYLESKSTQKKGQSSSLSPDRLRQDSATPQDTYPRGLGIMMEPSESENFANNEGACRPFPQ